MTEEQLTEYTRLVAQKDCGLSVSPNSDLGRRNAAIVALIAEVRRLPERIALLEGVATAAEDLLEENDRGDGAFAGVWAIDEYGQGVIVNLRDALAALGGEGPG